MSKYSILLFDADATLLDFKRSENEAVRECLDYYKCTSSDDVIETYSEINAQYWQMLERGEIQKEKLYCARWEALINYYGFDCTATDISNKYIERLTEKSYLIDGALKLCQDLYGKFKMYIVTNGQKSVQRGRLFPSPIFKYFDDCFISEDIGYEKPSPHFFEAIAKRIPSYENEKAIIIGDSLTSDMVGGINAGIDTCWYNPYRKELPANMKLTYIVNSLDTVSEILLK